MTFQLSSSCRGITFLTEICIYQINKSTPISSQYAEESNSCHFKHYCSYPQTLPRASRPHRVPAQQFYSQPWAARTTNRGLLFQRFNFWGWLQTYVNLFHYFFQLTFEIFPFSVIDHLPPWCFTLSVDHCCQMVLWLFRQQHFEALQLESKNTSCHFESLSVKCWSKFSRGTNFFLCVPTLYLSSWKFPWREQNNLQQR